MFLNKYKTLAQQKKFSFVFTNQYRNKIDIRGKTGTQLKEYGGKNVPHNSDTIIKIELCKYKEDKEFKNISEAYNEIGFKGIAVTLEIIKSNKRTPAKFPAYLVYGKGIGDTGNYIYALRCLNIIKQSGSYYYIVFQGQEIKENGMTNFFKKIIKLKIRLYDLYKNEIDEFYKT